MTLHIDIPTRHELEALLRIRRPGCVSIYLPTTPVTPEAEGDRIELKNLAAEAVRQLESGVVGKREIAAVGDALEELHADDAFWAYQANSLAVFATPERLLTFRLPNRLVSLVEVSDRLHLKPLLRTVTFPQARSCSRSRRAPFASSRSSPTSHRVSFGRPGFLTTPRAPSASRRSAIERPTAVSRARKDRRSGSASTPARSTTRSGRF